MDPRRYDRLPTLRPFATREREDPESEDLDFEVLEPDLHLGVFNAMHMPV